MYMNTIKNYISLSKKNVSKIIIIIVGNAREITKITDDFNNGTSIASEYYALHKFNQIVEVLNNEGFETLSYFDEMDFIHDYLTQRIRNNYYKPFVVLNFAQKGVVRGRKSLIPLFCEMNNIIHTNSDPLVCSLVREKFIWYKLLQGICPICSTWIYDSAQGWIYGTPEHGEKVIAKLENQCSSLGLSAENVFNYTQNSDNFLFDLSRQYKSRVIIQKFVSGYEVEFPFCYDGNSAFCLRPQGIEMNNKNYLGNIILDYDIRKNHKYHFYNFDEFNPDLSKKIATNIEKVAKILNIQGIGRIDCRITKKNEYYITDVNSNPQLIEIASPAEALRQSGFKEYSELFHLLIGVTLTRHPNQIE